MEQSPLRINIKPSVKPIIKGVLSLRGFLMLLIGLGVLHTGISFIGESWVVSLICFAAFIFFLVLAVKFYEQVFYQEYLLLEPEGITVVLKTFVREKQQYFAINALKHLGFAGQRAYTHNAMYSPVFDITGLEAGEKEMQYVIDDGTMEIETADKKHRFGKNMNSWDTEEIIKQIENYYGQSFSPQINDEPHEA